jgi:hypothetical protein
MRRIDDSTLEMIAELICGGGGGYTSPGPYRTLGEISAFFDRAGVDPKGQSSTRKWFALESLQSANGTIDLNKVVLRLASPKEYRGNPDMTNRMVDYLNEALRVEGLEICLIEVDPRIQECPPSLSIPNSSTNPGEADLDSRIPLEDDALLGNRWVTTEGSRPNSPTSTTVFIGHGRSEIWRQLKDLLGDRLGLTVDEFNRVSTAGVATTDRLSAMLDAADVAFLVMTAEDEQPDGQFRARENVVHEAGLFQRRLGFQRAIVLVEEGCEEFSNIFGLGQIKFQKGNIKSAFEEIRMFLERENIIESEIAS